MLFIIAFQKCVQDRYEFEGMKCIKSIKDVHDSIIDI